MTTVISRVYQDGATAKTITTSLAEAGFPSATYEVITPGKDVSEAMVTARVPAADVPGYMAVLTGTAAMVVVRAPVTPFGAARTAMALVDAVDSLDVEVARQEVHIIEKADPARFKPMTVLKDHPRWFSPDLQPGSARRRSLMSEVFYWPLLSGAGRRPSAARSGGFMSTKIIKYPLLSARKPAVNTIITGGKRFFYQP